MKYNDTFSPGSKKEKEYLKYLIEKYSSKNNK
jgi:hypothetical protein